ncbi:MAG: cell division protein FtsA [Bacteroidales bacterium]|jgi:cell division protein FtsA|nr:cell division protein FtsA [Bacteroidales bacterium]
MARKKIIGCIDIGASFITLVTGYWDSDAAGSRRLAITACVPIAAQGIVRSRVFNVEEAAKCVAEAKMRAENIIKKKITDVWVNISGHQFKSFTVTSELNIDNREITSADLQDMLNSARTVELPQIRDDEPERYLCYEIYPKYFSVDGEERILNPAGIRGKHVCGEYLVIAAPAMNGDNLRLCIEKAGLKIVNRILDPFAAAEVLLSAEEKEKGVILVDIGGGSTKLLVFSKGRPCHYDLFPYGGKHITADIQEAAGIPESQAERLKTRYGKAMDVPEDSDNDVIIQIPDNTGWEPKGIDRRSLIKIINGRLTTIVEHVGNVVEKIARTEPVNTGIILTGRTAALQHIEQLFAENTGFETRVRKQPLINSARPTLADAVNNSTALGLLFKMLVENPEFVGPPKTPFIKVQMPTIFGTLANIYDNIQKAAVGEILGKGNEKDGNDELW